MEIREASCTIYIDVDILKINLLLECIISRYRQLIILSGIGVPVLN